MQLEGLCFLEVKTAKKYAKLDGVQLEGYVSWKLEQPNKLRAVTKFSFSLTVLVEIFLGRCSVTQTVSEKFYSTHYSIGL